MNRKSLLILLGILTCYVVSFAQTTIKGKVTDQSKVGIPGVSVLAKGSTAGASTDGDGNYSISMPAGVTTLVFKSIGFTTQEIVVGSNQVINVSLVSTNNTLDDVIVVAYGTAKKGSYTGAASVLSEKVVKDVPVTSFENSLNGRIAGVQVAATSGQAGSTSSIRIRGIGSINASNEPLYVVDGVPVVSGDLSQMGSYTRASNNVMSTINPDDIETFTVLKDAAASALYGSRAANGVIIITTKRGKKGKPVISLKSAVGFTPTWATDNYEAASPQDQANLTYRLFHDLRTQSGQSEAAASAYAIGQLNTRFNKHGYKFSVAGTGLAENVIISGMTDGIENREGQYFDWEDALFRTGVFQTHDISVSGGDDNTTYYSSFSYTKDQNRIRINEFDRFSGRINLNQKVGKYVDFTTNVNIARNNQSGFNDTRSTGANYFLQTRNLLWPFYWPTDYKTGAPWNARYGSLAQNNVYYDNEWENSSITKRISASETLNIKILPELNFKSVFSYDNTDVKDHLYYSALHFSGVAAKGSVDEMATDITKIVSSTTLNYNKSFGLHNVTLLAGFEAEDNTTKYQRSSGTDLPSSSLHSVATAGLTNASAYEWGNSIVSFLSRAEYNYNQKYYLSGSYRRDASSRLSPETRGGNFWSVAGAWKINGEDFMKDVSVISNLRLRASYGVNGTLPSSEYGWRSLTGYGSKYMNLAGGAVTGIGNENLSWETSYTSNIALEFGLFNQRLTGTVEFFNRDSKNLLLDVPISMVTGFSTSLRNVGEVNNKGFELEIGGDIIRNANFRWTASVNAAFINSKVTKLYRAEGQSTGNDIIWYDPTGGDARAQYIYREGSSMLSFYGYEWAGVDPSNGRNVWYVNDPNNGSAGDFQYNGRGATYTYGKANYKIIGDGTPDVYGGLNTDIEYKGITLGLNFTYKIGGDLYDGAFKDVADDGYYFERIRSQYYVDNMWTAENPTGSLPKIQGVDLTDPIQYSTRQMHDASFLRLKNITLGYSLPRKLIGKIGLSNTRIYFNGSNLLTFSKYKIADPEVNQFSTRGWETPYGKTYTFGIELGF
ncbi:SusC/RagA family TonB-linked outer membrane protein [Pedobacter sp. MW01-1-1]|uniref:SusC/RagA family TonB-linked outer membrane protein n=1 Tax=Pedobacter sp. MW01-1-1 TaxID=3383027 RepID=UPI003FF0BEEF